MDDKDFEALQSSEQFRKRDSEPMIAPHLLTEEHCREHESAPLGVGLEVSDPLPLGSGETQQPQNQRGERGDEQQGFETLGALRSRVVQILAALDRDSYDT